MATFLSRQSDSFLIREGEARWPKGEYQNSIGRTASDSILATKSLNPNLAVSKSLLPRVSAMDKGQSANWVQARGRRNKEVKMWACQVRNNKLQQGKEHDQATYSARAESWRIDFLRVWIGRAKAETIVFSAIEICEGETVKLPVEDRPLIGQYADGHRFTKQQNPIVVRSAANSEPATR